MKFVLTAAATLMLAAPAFSQDAALQGDAAAGEEQFGRQCVACHVVVNDAGETLAGRAAKTGPNLYGVAGRPIGSYPEFRYGDSIVALGETGEVWTEENFVGYVQDPTEWLREKLDDSKARGKMAYKVRAEEDAYNLYAYLSSLAPAADAPATN